MNAPSLAHSLGKGFSKEMRSAKFSLLKHCGDSEPEHECRLVRSRGRKNIEKRKKKKGTLRTAVGESLN